MRCVVVSCLMSSERADRTNAHEGRTQNGWLRRSFVQVFLLLFVDGTSSTTAHVLSNNPLRGPWLLVRRGVVQTITCRLK